MISYVVFRTDKTVCPECHFRLVTYRTERRTIRSWEMGEFTAVHKIMRCSKHGTLFRSEKLESIVNPHCIYANDIMLEASMEEAALTFLPGSI